LRKLGVDFDDMAITREKKETLVADLAEKLTSSKSVVFTDYRGLTVEEIDEVRNQLREQGIEFKVIKNTLFKLAAKQAGIEISEDVTSGHPVAIAFAGDDEVAPAKITYTYTKKNDKFAIIGGIFEGKQISDIMVKSLASLPGREELYAKIVGSLASPLSGMVNVLQGNIRGLVTVLGAYRDTK
jgi:large subunit ribosomal protein L10